MTENKEKIDLYEDLVKSKEDLIKAKEGHITLLNDLLSNLKYEVKHKDEIIKKQHHIIKTFRKSIVYPLFLITSKFGRTKLGRLIRRIIK